MLENLKTRFKSYDWLEAGRLMTKSKSRVCVAMSVPLQRVALGSEPRLRAGEHLFLARILIRQLLFF
jgi:hypothetical protein